MNKKFALFLILMAGVAFGCKMLNQMLPKRGTEFRVQIDTTAPDKGAIVERAIAVTQNKLNAVGLDGEVGKDPNDSNVIIVRVYGTDNLERAKTFLFTTYQLELRKAISDPNPNPITTYRISDDAKRLAKSDQEVFPFMDRNDPFEKFVIVEKNAIVNGDDIRDAQAVLVGGKTSENEIAFSLKKPGAEKFGEWTGKNINNYLAVVLDNKVQSIAYIKGQIFDSGVINGKFTKDEAEDVAMSLRSGYLPATMKVLDEKHIGN